MIGKRRMEWGNDTWVLKIDGPNPSFHSQKSRNEEVSRSGERENRERRQSE
jgi:hypothetical protein